MSYDIIGDIHGHAEALGALLSDMGYRNERGAWRHSQRTAIFVGDFIDRGPRQVETVDLVRRMVDAGSAQAVLGNHEFNAIAWFLPDPEQAGEYLRPHNSPKYGDKNFKQHAGFLQEVAGTPRHAAIIDWFLSLPLWLDLGGIRVVHACWHPTHMAYLKPRLSAGNCLSRSLMVEASREPADESEKDAPEASVFKAVEALTKGIEIPLPAGFSITDKDGQPRRRVRTRWWDREAESFRCAALMSEDMRKELPGAPIPEHFRIGHDGGTPLFVGHYWLTGAPKLLSDKVACVDYSVARDGKLVAYRWDGEPSLSDAKFHWVGKGTV